MSGLGRACVVGSALALILSACDPVVDDAVAALGGEANGVRPGPLHRPGQPCLLCHDGSLGSPPEFSVAGTVFETASSRSPARGVSVQLSAADASQFTTQTNAAGNFYIQPSRWAPVFPLMVKLTYQGESIEMDSKIGRDGACASCHADPAGPASPGHVYLYDVSNDAGVP